MDSYDTVFSAKELRTLASIIQVGDATYRELEAEKSPLFSHQYFGDVKNRIRTKLVQIQAEIESREPRFPFLFAQRTFPFNHVIPELRTDKVLIHIAQVGAPDELPSYSEYKLELSNKNELMRRQLILSEFENSMLANDSLYGLLVFGGREKTFAAVQNPEPGYTRIANIITIPQVIEEREDFKSFERKKAALKQEFWAQHKEEIS